MAKNRARMMTKMSQAHQAFKKDVQRIMYHLLNTMQSSFVKRYDIEQPEEPMDLDGHSGFSAIALHYYGR